MAAPKPQSGRASGVVACEPGAFVARETVYRGRENFPRHEHEFSSLFVILDGEVREQAGRHEIDCGVGSIGFIPAGESHASRFGDGPAHGLTVVIDENWLRDAGVFRRREGVGYAPSGRAAVTAMRLNVALRRPDVSQRLVVEEALTELLAATGAGGSEGDSRIRGASSEGWIHRVTEMLTEQCVQPLSLSEVARCAGRNHAHAARAFRAATGSSMTEHVQTARITRACAMLRTTRASLVEVALRSGFFDQAHFTRVFRRVMGDTPARYRASFR